MGCGCLELGSRGQYLKTPHPSYPTAISVRRNSRPCIVVTSFVTCGGRCEVPASWWQWRSKTYAFISAYGQNFVSSLYYLMPGKIQDFAARFTKAADFLPQRVSKTTSSLCSDTYWRGYDRPWIGALSFVSVYTYFPHILWMLIVVNCGCVKCS
jgi:hypothetical protein